MARRSNPWLVGGLVVAVILALFGVGLAWALTPLGPDAAAQDALRTYDGVEYFETEYGYAYAPMDDDPSVGLILYPGGRVDYRSYSPLAREVAQRGYFVAVVEMPLSLAVLAPNSADEVIDANPEMVMWAVGGHSLGGAMAARYALDNEDDIKGLALLAAYPASSDDLSERPIQSTSIYATLDGVANAEKYADTQSLLPTSTVYVAIPGGNHSQFGSYGLQTGDNPAMIPADEQRWQTVNAIQEMLLPLRRRSGSLDAGEGPAA